MKLKKRMRLFLFFLLALFLIGFLLILVGFSWYLTSFSRQANLSSREVAEELINGLRAPYQEKYLTFLILGLDQRPTEETLLTDTILLITINTKTGNYLLFSLPRDLWLDDLKTKINALYYYGQKKDPNDGTQLIKERLEEILDWPINYVLVLKMEQIKELIDLVGGIEVEVERGFIDEQYPRDDGSGEVMTIEFKPGRQIFNGERALQFMRSRKSKDLIEGTDQARQKRQKKVILALKAKLLKNYWIIFSPKNAGKLYRFLAEEIETQPRLDLKNLASFWSLGLRLVKGKQIEVEIPWQGEEAILIPGRDPIYRTWILEPKNSDWSLMRDYFWEKISQLE